MHTCCSKRPCLSPPIGGNFSMFLNPSNSHTFYFKKNLIQIHAQREAVPLRGQAGGRPAGAGGDPAGGGGGGGGRKEEGGRRRRRGGQGAHGIKEGLRHEQEQVRLCEINVLL